MREAYYTTTEPHSASSRKLPVINVSLRHMAWSHQDEGPGDTVPRPTTTAWTRLDQLGFTNYEGRIAGFRREKLSPSQAGTLGHCRRSREVSSSALLLDLRWAHASQVR